MLYLIGLGLNSENDLPMRAVEVLENCDRIYCELFTSRWAGNISTIEDIAGKDIKLLKREEVEGDFLIKDAKKGSVALLVPGDPLTATTHFQLLLEAKKSSVPIEIVHASSIYTAVAETGLYIYKFGRATTLPFFEDGYKPQSPFEVIKANKQAGLHTLVMLDINQEEEKYMTALDGLHILDESGFADASVVACCRLGSRDSVIKYGKVPALAKDTRLNQSPAALVVVGELNFKEEEALRLWM